ncbi:protein disulfide oxidoreductase DsbA [Salmonella enterica subsp. enterica serovar Urbana]|nr:protein disulfide oxidoreductase DsbA [Salmonella enterica subsp. enterica serovar Urbana]
MRNIDEVCFFMKTSFCFAILLCIFPFFVSQFAMADRLRPGAVGYSVIEGKQYRVLSEKVEGVPNVLEFFSFYCQHCYQFEQEFHLSAQVQDGLPKGVNVVKYHVSSMGPLGADLTRAWAVAGLLGVEDKIEPALFDAIQNKRTVHTTGDIRRVFTESGIRGEDYDLAWTSFAVNSMVVRQEKAMSDFRVKGVPVMYVRGQYQIIPQGMDADSLEVFMSHYAETVRYLAGKK